MPIPVVCSGCQKRIQAPDTAAGKKARCPVCKTLILIPKLEPPEPEPIEVVPEEDFESPDEDFEQPDEEVDQATAISQTPSKKSRDSAISAKKKKDSDDDDYGVEEEDEYERKRRRKKKKHRDEEDDDYGGRRSLRSKEPHRGVLILVLGILSIVTSCFCPLLCWVLAAISVNMANTDVARMDSRIMDSNGMGMTKAGMICAYVGVLLGLLSCVAGIGFRLAQKG